MMIQSRGRSPAFDAIVEFGVGADSLVADQQTGAGVRVLAEQLFDDRHDRVLHRSDAEDRLIVGIIEFEGRLQLFGDVILDAADRTNDRHRRRIDQCRQRVRTRLTANRGRNDADNVKEDG